MSLCMLRSTRVGAALRSVAAPRPSISRIRCPTGSLPSKSWSSRLLSTSRLGDSFLAGNNAHYIDEMYLQWKQDPSSVHKSWDVYFRKGEYQAPPTLVADYSSSAVTSGSPSAPAVSAALSGGVSPQVLEDTSKLIQMIRAFQVRGHFFADIDPLGIEKVRRGYKTPQELELSNYGFTEKDLDRQFPLSFLNTKGFLNNEGQQSMTLREIYTRLKEAYSDKIGVEYMHITDVDQCNWIRERVETRKKIEYTRAQKLELLERMTWADHFERFLAKKFTIKRFGLEGAESMIVALKGMIDRSSQLGVEDVIIGMPHRGRLNVLSSVVKKPMEQILNECSGVYEESEGSGDVKYHLGRSHVRTTYEGKKIHITLLPNPSHLEAVNPVVAGKVRARQHYASDKERRRVMGVILHGDAAFSGQGVVYETLGMWDLPHYSTGGSIHVIVNNQIGFTTDPADSRSSAYCSELAKAVGSPIFHVNGDDPEAVARVAEICSEWRQQWGKDIFIDLVCYRKHGHNEVDEPMFTQPLMYTKIKQQPSSLEVYTKNLIEKGQVTAEEAKAISDKVNKWLEEKFEASKSFKPPAEKNSGAWGELKGPSVIPATGVSPAKIRELNEKVNTLPADLTPHRNIGRIYEARKKSFVEGKDIDWGGAESMAFATLLAEGSHVRVSGQDAQRGTFSHRHAVVHEQNKLDRPPHMPLAAIGKDLATFEVSNSHLSEFAVLGFEYGYATENPTALVIWEAQFGDFVNGAQVIIDQFISCAETKWKRQAGLVMLLPHAYEGAGPEHSSARLERFLQLCDEDPDTFVDSSTPAAQEKQIHGTNYQVVNITSPANLFHALRRQVRRGFRKPLVVMSPKSLLKHRLVKSTIDEFAEGTHFLPLIKESSTNLVPAKQMRRVIFCSGHVYYDLLEHREKKGIKDVAIVRVEQIAPFPFSQVQEQLKQYSKAEIVWCQEEHMNMGAWTYVEPRLETASGHKQRARYVGRPAAASPAAGNHVLHEKELHDFLEAAFE